MTTPQRESATTDRSYGGVPAHERIAARRARLTEAGRRLFGTQGVAATTVRGTCEASGLSQRYFYESFRSVEALAIAVADEITEEVIGAAFEAVAAVEATTSDLDAHALVRARARVIFTVLVEYIAADPGAGRIMFIESAGNGADFAAWRRQMLVRAAALNEIWFRKPLDESLQPGDAGPEDQIAALVITGGVVEAIVAWLEGDVVATADQLARSLAHAMDSWPEGGIVPGSPAGD